jgi:cytochrome P450 family 6
VLIYWFNKTQFQYWKKQKIPQLKPTFLIGDIKDLALQRKSLADYFADIYNASKNVPLVGLYFSYTPTILITDVQLAKRILTKDFHYFHDRGILADEKLDPLTGNLFCLSGDKWKNLRQQLTPLFSCAKLRSMFPIVHDCVRTLDTFIHEKCESKTFTFDIRDLSSKFTLTLISSIAFGVNNDSINNPNNIFRMTTLKVLEPKYISNMRIMMAFFMPQLSKGLKLRFFEKDVEDFYSQIVRTTIQHRKRNQVNRNDFLELLTQTMTTISSRRASELDRLSMGEVVANAFIFVMAGYETTAATISYCLYEISKDKKILKKVQDEIDEIMKGGEFTYDKVNELKYLECCVNETLRKYSVAPMLNRSCLFDYKVKGTNYTIPKGSAIIIPIFAMQRDARVIENPMKFIPERFMNGSHLNQDAFIAPFGVGQRACVGARMAIVIIKLTISYLLASYNTILISPQNELEFTSKIATLTPKEQILISFEKRHCY